MNIYNIIIQKDIEVRVALSLAFEKLSSPNNYEAIFISLPTNEWISANALNFIVTFIEAVKYYFQRYKVYIELIDIETTNQLLFDNNQGDEEEFQTIVTNVVQKLHFYESMELFKYIQGKNTYQIPDNQVIEDIKQKVNYDEIPKKWKYSSKMLSLNPLIEGEVHQIALSSRLNILTNILTHNLYQRISRSQAKDASAQIMYELVKNIYQHAYEHKEVGKFLSGFACAQINKYSIINNRKYDMSLLQTVLETIRNTPRKKTWSFLSISICDYGIGLDRVIYKNLNNSLAKFNNEFVIDKFRINEKFITDSYSLIEFALRTEYSTKKLSLEDVDSWRESMDKRIPLERRGRGLLFCLGFIARFFGRLQIRSNNIILEVFSTAAAPVEEEKWIDTVTSSKMIFEDFDKYFEIRKSQQNGFFPGTQVLIEIPVEVFY